MSEQEPRDGDRPSPASGRSSGDRVACGGSLGPSRAVWLVWSETFLPPGPTPGLHCGTDLVPVRTSRFEDVQTQAQQSRCRAGAQAQAPQLLARPT